MIELEDANKVIENQGLKGNMERSEVPEKLCLEIIQVCEQNALEEEE